MDFVKQLDFGRKQPGLDSLGWIWWWGPSVAIQTILQSHFGPKSALGAPRRSKFDKTKSACFFKLDLEKVSFWVFSPILSPQGPRGAFFVLEFGVELAKTFGENKFLRATPRPRR